MEAQGPTLSIETGDGSATITLFFESTTGQPMRVVTDSSTQHAYKVELEGAARQTLAFLIPAGNASHDVPSQVAKGIDVRPDIEGVFTNTSIWTMRLDS